MPLSTFGLGSRPPSGSRFSRRWLTRAVGCGSAFLLLLGGVLVCDLIGCRRERGTALLTSAASSAASSDTTRRPPIPDTEIALAVQRHLEEDSALRSERVDGTVTNGICTISGTVRNLLAKERALRVVEALRGVRSVINRVDVMPVMRTDDQLRSDVIGALKRDVATRAHLITVAASDGRVALLGVVGSWPERLIFEEVAKAVRGVKSIDNQLTVKYTSVPSDSQIAVAVKHRIANDVWLDSSVIGVTVSGHSVQLTGVVGSVAEKSRAHLDAWLAGVEAVDDAGVVVDWAAHDDQRHVLDDAVRSDDEIARAIHDAFNRDPRLATFVPKVAVHHGVVDLSGAFESSKARRAAALDVTDTVGVTDVRDRTTVQPVGKPTDADITDGVTRALSEDLLLPDSPAIHASTTKGKVVLQGAVSSGFERFDAVEDATSIPGVVEVVDELTVRRSPQDIKANIDDRLSWDATVERDRVKVEVTPDGVATLRGTLDKGSEIRAAVDDATWAGATHVINELQLRTPTTTR